MKKPKIFVCLDEQEMLRWVAKAKTRIVFAAPSISEALAIAISTQVELNPQLRVDVILDVAAETLRLGYGELGALKHLTDRSIDIRCAPGLKIGVLAIDTRSFVFAPTAKIIHDPETNSPNAINIDPTMTEWLLHAMIPKDMIVERAKKEISPFGDEGATDADQPGEPPIGEDSLDDEIIDFDPIIDPKAESAFATDAWTEPEIGGQLFSEDDMEELAENIERRPPKEFDHEREILVYNGYLRFVDTKFTGGRLSSRTIQLPTNILSVAKEGPEMIEIKASCKLFETAGVMPEVVAFEQRVDETRRQYTRSLGHDLGRVVLIKDVMAFDKAVEGLKGELVGIRESAVSRISCAIKRRKKRLKKILFPLLSKNPTDELKHWIENLPNPWQETIGRYLTAVLDDVFPDSSAMIDRMDLRCIYKDVTWEMLNEKKFGDAIKRIFPKEEFTGLYSERNTIGERQPKPRERFEADDEWPSEIV